MLFRSDFAAIAQVSTDLCPFLELADLVETTARLHGLFESVEVQGLLVDVGHAMKVVVALLLVKLGQGVEIRDIGSCAWEDRVSSSENTPKER